MMPLAGRSLEWSEKLPRCGAGSEGILHENYLWKEDFPKLALSLVNFNHIFVPKALEREIPKMDEKQCIAKVKHRLCTDVLFG